MNLDINLLASSISAISASGAALAGFLAWKENKKISEAQTQPFIDVKLETMPHSVRLFRLIIRNTGLGHAFRIRLTLKPHQSMNSAQREVVLKIIERFSRPRFIENGLNYLASTDYRYSSYINLIGLNNEVVTLKEFLHSIIEAKVEYFDLQGKRYEHTFEIDMNEYDGNYTLGENFEIAVPQQLSKIKDEIKELKNLHKNYLRLLTQQSNKEQRKKSIAELRREARK